MSIEKAREIAAKAQGELREEQESIMQEQLMREAAELRRLRHMEIRSLLNDIYDGIDEFAYLLRNILGAIDPSAKKKENRAEPVTATKVLDLEKADKKSKPATKNTKAKKGK